LSWITSKGGTIENSWEVWWREETAVYRRLQHSSKLLIASKAAVYVVLARGLADRDLGHATQLKHFAVVVAALAGLAAVQLLADRAAYSLRVTCAFSGKQRQTDAIRLGRTRRTAC
jgi:hypothetical protein